MSLLRRLIALLRATRFALHLVYGLALAVFYPWLNLRARRHILQRWSAELLQILNVRLDLAHAHHLRDSCHALIVSNHVSWLDIFVLNSVVPMRFVAKSDVRGWPVIGWLCARGQTLFIERGKARSAARVNMQMVALLQRGECLAIFPEGTSTDGAQVAHFHSSLLQPAIDAATQIQPVALRYHDSHGRLCGIAPYIGDLSFLSSLWGILNAQELHVSLFSTPPLSAHGTDRRSLTRLAQQQVTTALAALQSSLAQTAHDEPGASSLRFQSLYCVLLNQAHK
jgi:1-acyl-sn-glycerol-3-phosphate acyltransferase